MTLTTFQDQTITRDDVLQALRRFDTAYPNTNQYDNWLEKRSYKYALRYGDKLYPCKHILAEAAGLPDTRSFSGGIETNRVFEALGFTIIHKPV